jgi:16S rRNA processing protein RimM
MEMYLVGKVLKPQGIKGEVKAEIITSFPEHFNELEKLFLKRDRYEPIEIEHSRISGSFAYLKLSGIGSRNDAELLRNELLYIPESSLYALDNDEYYHHHLVGLKVFSESQDDLGIVSGIESYPGNDVLVCQGSGENEFLVPVVKEIVLEIDVEAGKIVINKLDGLVD